MKALKRLHTPLLTPRNLNIFEVYLTAPAAIPFIIYLSSIMAITIKGRIAANDNAAIDHHEIPCEPVWLATITGNVFA